MLATDRHAPSFSMTLGHAQFSETSPPPHRVHSTQMRSQLGQIGDEKGRLSLMAWTRQSDVVALNVDIAGDASITVFARCFQIDGRGDRSRTLDSLERSWFRSPAIDLSSPGSPVNLAVGGVRGIAWHTSIISGGCSQSSLCEIIVLRSMQVWSALKVCCVCIIGVLS